MKHKKIDGLEISPPKGTSFAVETPKGLPKLHCVSLFIGKRGSGKTVALASLLKNYKNSGCLDRLIIVSPNYLSNKHIFEGLPISEDDVYTEPDATTVKDIISKIEQESQEYEAYQEKLRIWKKLTQTHSELLPFELMSIFDGVTGDFTKPTHKYNGKKPVVHVIFDDCQGSAIFSPKARLSNMVIRHRHIGAFNKLKGAIGCSLHFCVQSYKSSSAGLPRTIRNQATFVCLFKTKDAHELKEIGEECSGEVSEDQFNKVYEEATSEPHSFLMLDFHKCCTDPSMFRKRFDTYLISNESK
jgi:hypothetical protein